MTLYLGFDGGGTSCRVALARADGTIIGRAVSGAANINTNLAGARGNIVEAAGKAFADAGEDASRLAETPAVLGLAGANVGENAQHLKAILPFTHCSVETDAMIALEGAVGSGDGAIAILGTGTAYLGRRSGIAQPIGGWGFMVSDQGSGAQIGRDLIERTLLAYDRTGPSSPLTEDMLAIFRNDPSNIVGFASSAKPGDFGQFAPKVFEYGDKGDPVAGSILARGLEVIEASIQRFGLKPGEPLCLLGGLAASYATRLSPGLSALLRQPKQEALGGAVAMAIRMFGSAR